MHQLRRDATGAVLVPDQLRDERALMAQFELLGGWRELRARIQLAEQWAAEPEPATQLERRYSITSGFDFSGARFFTLGIDNSKKPPSFDGIPWLSVGAQMGHGTDGPLAILDSTAGETYLRFSVTKNVDSIPGIQYHPVFILAAAMWAGKKRIVAVTLQQQSSECHADDGDGDATGELR